MIKNTSTFIDPKISQDHVYSSRSELFQQDTLKLMELNSIFSSL